MRCFYKCYIFTIKKLHFYQLNCDVVLCGAEFAVLRVQKCEIYKHRNASGKSFLHYLAASGAPFGAKLRPPHRGFRACFVLPRQWCVRILVVKMLLF